MAALEQTLPALGEIALTRAAAPDPAARIEVGHAPPAGTPRRRVLEAVPPFAFLAMPAQELR